MAAAYRIEGVVCARYKLGESDRILHIYSDRGMVRAVAKGSRKPKSRFTGRLEPFCHVSALMATGKNLHIVSQVELLDSHDKLKHDLNAIAVGSAMLSLVERVSEHESDPGQMLPLLVAALRRLDSPPTGAKNGHDPLVLLSAFELKVAGVLGHRPSFGHCVSCGEAQTPAKGSIRFDLEQAGMICDSCAKDVPMGETVVELSQASARVITSLAEKPMAQLDRLSLSDTQVREVRSALQMFLSHHLELNIKSYRFLARYLNFAGKRQQ